MSTQVWNREISFTIFEKPIPQKRHRHTKTGRTYDPNQKDKMYYRILIRKAIEQYHLTPMLQGPLCATMNFYFAFPKTKQSQKNKGLYVAGICDTDNCIKYMLDCLTGIIYNDDRQVYRIVAQKLYTLRNPRTIVTIKEVMQEPILENNNGKNTSVKENKSTKETRRFMPSHSCASKRF